MIRACAGFLAAVVMVQAAQAQDLRLPGNATETARQSAEADSHIIATGPWAAGALPYDRIEGTVTTTTWRIAAQGITTLQILRPLRDQLTQAGFAIGYSCDTADCGGFDFRFAIPVAPPPDMQVNLGDFRYLAATRLTPEGRAAVSLLVSRTGRAGYVQLVQVGPASRAAPTATSDGAALRSAAPTAVAVAPGTLAEGLETVGRAVLADLAFDTGSASLSAGTYASLQDLADYLSGNPDLTVALVGHTDAEGSLDGNIALSKRRAGSVLERLATDYGVPRRQLEAQGMGYLSPIANNRTEDGRTANRRVEVIITSTE